MRPIVMKTIEKDFARRCRRGAAKAVEVARIRSMCGQTTTEWLMVAGVLTAVGIFLLRFVPGALRTFMGGLMYGIKSLAP